MRWIAAVAAASALAGCAGPLASGVEVPIAPPPRPVPELVAELRSPDASVRAAAACGLAGAGQVEPAVAHALLAALDDSADPVRECATWAVSHVSNPLLQGAVLAEVPPKRLLATNPHYPEEAFAQGIAGTVLLEILISASGDVVHAEARRSIPALDAAALACVREWKFHPAMRGGEAVPAMAIAPVTFRSNFR